MISTHFYVFDRSSSDLLLGMMIPVLLLFLGIRGFQVRQAPKSAIQQRSQMLDGRIEKADRAVPPSELIAGCNFKHLSSRSTDYE